MVQCAGCLVFDKASTFLRSNFILGGNNACFDKNTSDCIRRLSSIYDSGFDSFGIKSADFGARIIET